MPAAAPVNSPPSLTARAGTAVASAPGIHLVAGTGSAAALASALASFTPAEAAALWSAVTIVSGVASGLLRRPVHLALSSAAVTTVLGDLAVLGVHLPPGIQGAVLAGASLLGGTMLHAAPSLSACQAPVTEPPPVKQVPFPADLPAGTYSSGTVTFPASQ